MHVPAAAVNVPDSRDNHGMSRLTAGATGIGLLLLPVLLLVLPHLEHGTFPGTPSLAGAQGLPSRLCSG